MDALRAGAVSDVASVKFGAMKAFRLLSERAPDLVYRHFGFFAGLLGADNPILRWNAMLIVGNLAAVDHQRKIDRIIDAYLAPIAGPHLIDAANAMKGAAAIAQAKPYLADRIARRILAVEQAAYDTPECRNVVIGHAIQRLGRFGFEDCGQADYSGFRCAPVGESQSRDAQESPKVSAKMAGLQGSAAWRGGR